MVEPGRTSVNATSRRYRREIEFGSGNSSVAGVVQDGDRDGRRETIDTEHVPTVRLKPLTEPFESQQAGQKRAERTEDAWHHGGCQGRATRDVLRLHESQRFP